MLMFSFGALTMMELGLALPHIEPASGSQDSRQARVIRTGSLIAIGVTLRNFTEGFAVVSG
jgi:zinc transporter ZupT